MKEKEQKTVSASPVSATPSFMDPSEVKLLGQVEGDRAAKTRETTPVGLEET